MTPETGLGFAHFFAQSDAVAKTLLAILVVMSIASWAIIAIKGLSLWLRNGRSQAFLNFFWNSTSLDAVAGEIATHGARDPFSHLTGHAMHAQAHHARYGAAKLEEAGSSSEFVTRTIKKVLDEEMTRLENGLTLLATVGATAPFVGLFGTVWGVYHALVAIGMSGAGTLDKVAGPVGEALIMTGLGLAVAIPAVVGYNWLTRANRVLAAKLDAFAYELHTFVSMGQPLGNSVSADAGRQRPAARRAAGGGLRSARHGIRQFRLPARRRPDGGDQHDPADRRDAGAAGHLHRHRAAADPGRQARAAEGDVAAQRAAPEKVEFAIDASGALYWNGEAVSRTVVRQRFAEESQARAARGAPACRPGRPVPLRRADPGRRVEGRPDQDRLRQRAGPWTLTG